MASKKSVKAPYIETKQGDRKFLLTKLPASIVTEISYAAIRGQTEEEGAVQRVLNQGRINSIKAFTLQGGDYPNAVVLNWVSQTNKITTANGTLGFTTGDGLAQLIDGQHRIAGIKAAIEENKGLGKLELPVVIYRNLSTKECADIFLSINTEQKPVPRSLVFDLYGVASESVVDHAAVRARDIAMSLNDTGSPYEGEIKMPGAAKRRGGIPLSSAVTGIKPLVEDNGVFEQIAIKELELQKQIILNWLTALQRVYGENWEDKDNVFQYASGFLAAMEFLRLQLIPYCNTQESFEVKTIETALKLSGALIYQNEVKGQGGAEAQKKIYARLQEAFTPTKIKASTKFKF
ncbi:MAG: DGQHR domain-containing protein [Acidovorax sp.]|uniref:DGQHR domain-containing protein n=1 Tax=Acidovorax sp. TaxID=1872122 RepID=UPI002635DE14|nr:DGQHR domain-containing protein [Acidovorax sp.]MDH4466060.1 DGQHR domain-containing protein [Acidovorax sp.]